MVDVIEVPARSIWVETPVWVKAGDALTLRADGTWIDAVIPCSADGYPAPFFYALGRPPRIPDGNRYFRLMGRIVADGAVPRQDDPAVTFPIGTSREWQATSPGRLFVFVNDRAGYYWNNWGSVRLTVIKK